MASKVGSVRETLNHNSAIVTIAAVLVLVFSLAYLVRTCTGGGRPPITVVDVYFYDLNSKQLFTAEASAVPPISAPSGPLQMEGVPEGTPAGVKAYVFACGDCSDESKRFIGYLEMYRPDAKQKMEEAAKAMESDAPVPDIYLFEEGWMEGRMIQREGDEQWVPANSEQGIAITMELSKRCGKGVRLKPCFPSR